MKKFAPFNGPLSICLAICIGLLHLLMPNVAAVHNGVFRRGSELIILHEMPITLRQEPRGVEGLGVIVTFPQIQETKIAVAHGTSGSFQGSHVPVYILVNSDGIPNQVESVAVKLQSLTDGKQPTAVQLQPVPREELEPLMYEKVAAGTLVAYKGFVPLQGETLPDFYVVTRIRGTGKLVVMINNPRQWELDDREREKIRRILHALRILGRQ